ncbi:nodulation factor fucose acetyltransferase NolL [Rhizobium sp. CCGE 510]|uniref:nodulation factor fucose acetyltransferase NolL n=1 Tax=Rhizobium sp. CCGE 510 TaxID=1132836 RepID=UPI00027B851A|nr:nodulation factor fucose acetyltransferase NolL [Rhizobium sp. CCGE 510]EJT01675.1 nodulation acetyltransferase [Rhizobium sp. CCGE 510]
MPTYEKQIVGGNTVLKAPEASDRDLALDFAKGILIILVIFGHLLQYIFYQGDGFWDSACFRWIYMFHMPLFMAISGYLCRSALLSKPFRQAIVDRVMQLLVPTLFWCTLLEAVKLIMLPRPPTAPDNVLQFLHDFVGTYWFIWAAFASFLFVKLISIFNSWSSRALLVSVILVALAPVTFSIFPLIKYTYPFFCVGFSFAQSREWWTSIMRPHKPLLMMFTSIAAILCFIAWREDTYVYNNLVLIQNLQSAKDILLMFCGSAAASAVMIEVLLQSWKIGRSSSAVRFIAAEVGQSTLLLYLVQGTVFRLMDSIQYGEGWTPTMKSAAALILGTMIVAVALAVRWSMRDIPYLSQLILGAPPRLVRLPSNPANN